jgi:putative chitinase
MITKEQLSIFTGVSLADKYYPFIAEQLPKAGINSKLRICAFLAQIFHESGNLKHSKELTGYSAENMCKVWPSRFPTLERANEYVGQKEKLFNYVYGGRMGNDQPGDGFKYIGRGFIGVTGKGNYSNLSKATGINFVLNPELLEQPEYALISSIWFWNKYNLSVLADAGDIKGITKQINGGQIGFADREAKYKKLLEIYK